MKSTTRKLLISSLLAAIGFALPALKADERSIADPVILLAAMGFFSSAVALGVSGKAKHAIFGFVFGSILLPAIVILLAIVWNIFCGEWMPSPS